jgi:hypothetical protein
MRWVESLAEVAVVVVSEEGVSANSDRFEELSDDMDRVSTLLKSSSLAGVGSVDGSNRRLAPLKARRTMSFLTSVFYISAEGKELVASYQNI